jgi:hypothetical protein
MSFAERNIQTQLNNTTIRMTDRIVRVQRHFISAIPIDSS